MIAKQDAMRQAMTASFEKPEQREEPKQPKQPEQHESVPEEPEGDPEPEAVPANKPKRRTCRKTQVAVTPEEEQPEEVVRNEKTESENENDESEMELPQEFTDKNTIETKG